MFSNKYLQFKFFVAVFVSLICFAQAFAADEYTKVPVIVNVLSGVSVDANEIADIVGEANKIFKKHKVQLEFDKTKNVKTNVSDTGNNDGKIQQTEETALDEAGAAELGNNFDKGKGIKIYITNEIRGKPNTNGLAPHVKEKDGKLTAKPVIYLKKNSETKASKGNDLAHECGHVLTLGKNHVIDKAKGVNADANGHQPSDSNNLEYPYNGGSTVRGSNLTDDQAEEIRKGAKKFGTTKVAEKVSKNKSASINSLQTIHGRFVDAMGETVNSYVDIGTGFFFAETSNSPLEISLLTEGLFPGIPVNIHFSIYFDTDNNIATGGVFGAFQGIDKIINIMVIGQQPGGQVDAFLQDFATGNTLFLPDARAERIAKIIDSNNVTDPPQTSDYVDGLYVSVPFDALQLSSNTVPVFAETEDLMTSDSDQAIYLWLVQPPGPQFELDETLLSFGQLLEFSGSGFTPLTNVEILLDDTSIASVPANIDGNIIGAISLPPLVGLIDENEYFFVTARDFSGKFDFSILELQRQPGNLNEDAIVDFHDFAVIALHWLASDWPAF